jgi:hypothetical protein
MSARNAPAAKLPTAHHLGRHSAQADRGQADPTTALLAKAYGRILSKWPCPDCGQPYPCPCDAAEQDRGRPQ